MRIRIIIFLVLIMLFGFVIRAYRLGYPPEMMFDEVYYVKSAQQYINGEKDSNLYHPPLAKQIIALGIIITSGINKYAGWRFGSLVFGFLMIPVLFLIGRRLYNDNIAFVGALFLSADFLHLVQSRIATLDIFCASFSLIGYLFAIYYLFPNNPHEHTGTESPGNIKPDQNTLILQQSSSQGKNDMRKKLPLFLSALFFGIATACKWCGFFGAIGIIIAIYLIPPDRKKKISDRTLQEVLPFLIIIILVYMLSYISWVIKGTSLATIFNYHIRMLHFRYLEKFEHNYLSYFWQWPTLIRPIWYHFQEEGDKVFGIIAIGSPFFWWSFLLMMPHLIISAWKRKTRADFIVAMGYFSQFLLWAIAFKGSFFYYMIQSVPWMCLWVAVWLYRYLPDPGGRWFRPAFIIGTLIIFVLWYPILTGFPVSEAYYSRLIWLRNWI